MRVRILGLSTLLLALSSAAPAAWHVAETKHFVIYADQKPEDLREFAARLEKFDKAVRHVRNMADYPVGDGNRLRVFVVRSDSTVRRLANDKSGLVRGFYSSRASGSLAFVPQRTGSGSQWDLDAETVFFHEYAHHLMFQQLDQPYPEWLVEGFAEFMSTVRFERDGSVGLGAAPLHRAYGLMMMDSMPLAKMLGAAYDRITEEERESIYGRGWLLAHYLTFEPSRSGQLKAYLDAIERGVPPLESATAAFGNIKALEAELTRYLHRSKIKYVKIAPTVLSVDRIDVSALSPGAAAVLPLRIESKRGVNAKTAEPLAVRVRALAARYPNDPLVEVTLAEAEFDAGHYAAAEAAADRALKLQPKNTEAMLYKGRAILERAAAAQPSTSALFAEARRWFVAANKTDPEDPEPLMLFYQSYVRSGARPTRNAIEGLHYASNLAPQDVELRMNSALNYLRDGKLAEARKTLIPVAYNPHGRAAAAAARQAIESIDATAAGEAIKALERGETPAEGQSS